MSSVTLHVPPGGGATASSSWLRRNVCPAWWTRGDQNDRYGSEHGVASTHLFLLNLAKT